MISFFISILKIEEKQLAYINILNTKFMINYKITPDGMSYSHSHYAASKV